MGMTSHKKYGTTFCGRLVCASHISNAPKGLRERNMSFYIVSEIISSDLDESQKSLFG